MNEKLIEESSKYDGYYRIQRSDPEMDEQDVFQAYRLLVMIKDCFRTMKSTLKTILRKKGMEASTDRIVDAIGKAVLCAFEVDGRQYFLKCRNNETAENIFSVIGVKKLPSFMTSEALIRQLQLNVVV
ncbi:MAG: hypothetical protein LBR61_06610 [Synergistaceae bacterium]|nr:hypothetical protein [Synergistaceae bacterium]